MKATVDFLKQLGPVPEAVLVLGSGLKVFENLEDSTTVPYADIPGFSVSTVAGHAGALTIGRFNGRRLAVLRGRFHRYEGYPWHKVVLPVTAMAEWGIPRLMLTNAAGGLNPTFRQGDLMLMRDHLNFQPPEPAEQQALYERYRQQNRACQQAAPAAPYDRELQHQALEAARQGQVILREGTYLALMGPTYETPAEIQAFRKLGADAVGMSTVPEVVWGHALGMRVLALSCITNVAHSAQEMAATSHLEVMEVAQLASERLETVLARMLGATGIAPLA